MKKQTLQRKFAGRRRASHTVARGLGWFSIGLGLAELLAPRALSRAIGMPGTAGFMRACGIREIATGIGILASRNPTPWVWARVAGDALDVSTLTAGLAGGTNRAGAAVGLASVAGVTFADLATAQILSELDAKDRMPWRDYSTRTGFPKGIDSVKNLEWVPAQSKRAETVRAN